jgi:hypothetical protein
VAKLKPRKDNKDMANKKDFSNVNTQPIYNMREEATAEPLPGQLAFKGNNGEIAPLDEAEEMSGPDAVNALEHSKAVFSAQLAHADLGENAPPEWIEEQAELRAAMGLPPKKYSKKTPGRKNNKRAGAGMKQIYTYLTIDNLNFLDTMAGIYGITRQAMLNDILQNAREESKIYNEAVKLRKEAEKGRADGT